MKREFVEMYKNPNGPGFIVEFGNPPGRWMQVKRPTQEFMRCEGAGCQHLTERGDWYWRDEGIGVLCERCASLPGHTITRHRDGRDITYEIPERPR